MVQLSDILEKVATQSNPLPPIKVNNLVLDSRAVQPHDMFVAVKGDSHDGAKFINAAQKNGACAVLVDERSDHDNTGCTIPVIKLVDLRNNLPVLADARYQNPSAKLTLIGVTGTNGKTTCAHLIAQALGHLSVLSAIIGTAGQGLPGQLSASSLTTPDVFEFRRLLAEFVKLDVQAVAFEASSHGLAQGRLDQLDLDFAVFTNLSHDHLDYHDDLEAYSKAKMKLFQFPNLKCAVMNADNPF